MAKDIYIHAGAHRTGTSSFQLCLDKNRAEIEAAGFDLGYPKRGGIKGGKLRLILEKRAHIKTSRAEWIKVLQSDLARQYPDASRPLILSEENIPGRMYPFYESAFFPNAPERLKVLADMLNHPPTHLLYVLRPYADLYRSAYRLRAAENPMPPFEDCKPALLNMQGGWPDLVQTMRDTLRPQNLTILTYDQRGSNLDLLHRLVPALAETPLTEPSRTLNVSATDAAIEAVQARFAAGEKPGERACAKIVRDYADLREDRGLVQFSEQERADLDGRFAEDLKRIKSMDGLIFNA